MSLGHEAPRRLLALAAAAALLVGCQSGGSLIRKDDSQSAKVRTLQQDLVEARQRAVMAEVESERLRGKVEQLEADLREARSRARQAPPAGPAGRVIDDVTIEASAPEIEEVELEEPPRPAPSRAPVPSSSAPVPSSPSPGPASPSPSSPSSTASVEGAAAQSLYDAAYTLFHQKRYAEAEASFEQFLGLHSQSHLADNAQFWIGESRWARGDFSSALSAFMATVEKYPQGNKVPDALLKAGRCLEALDQVPRAKVTYEELASRFPSTAAAVSARQRLAELR